MNLKLLTGVGLAWLLWPTKKELTYGIKKEKVPLFEVSETISYIEKQLNKALNIDKNFLGTTGLDTNERLPEGRIVSISAKEIVIDISEFYTYEYLPPNGWTLTVTRECQPIYSWSKPSEIQSYLPGKIFAIIVKRL